MTKECKKGYCKPQKHPCKDCFDCQFCSDTRCNICFSQKKRKKQMSLEDQLALYKELNKDMSL